MRVKHLLTVAAFSLSVAAFGLAPPAYADLSNAARATSVLDDQGKALSIEDYEDANAALRAGDMAAYLEALTDDTDNEITASSLRALILAVDELAEDDVDGARKVVAKVREDDEDSQLLAYVNAWIFAFEGNDSEAIAEHRAASDGLPGYSGDLSLASLLEGLGRNEEAVAVYESLIPQDITAPEHDFDIQGLEFSHIRTVVARQAILLRKLGRIEEAKDVYRKLAEAEPERAVGYAAAIAQIEDGKGLDDDLLTPRTALSRTLTDISSALSTQRIFRLVRAGQPTNTFDYTMASLDQAALLLTPDDEALRGRVLNTLHSQAYYDGAAHVALTAPEPTPSLGMSAALALLLQQEKDKARTALDMSLKIEGEPDEEFSNALRAARLYSFLEDEERALGLTDKAISMAENPSERAIASASKASILQHFGQYEDALVLAEAAAEIDNTNDRRTFVTSILGELDRDDEAIKILRRELLERPNDPNAMNSLGYYLIINTDKYEEGYKLLARATRLVPRSPYILDSLGWARYKLGDLSTAKRAIEDSRTMLSPERHWEIEDHLGDIYWHLGDKEGARKAWEAALEVYPPKRVREEIEAKLKDGITVPPPEKRAIPSISLEDDGSINERDI